MIFTVRAIYQLVLLLQIATLGGVGLTGFIVSAKIKLKSIKSNLLEINYKNFDTFEGFEELLSRNSKSEYAVSWFNCKGGKNFRGLMQIANHSLGNEIIPPKKSVTLPIPSIKLVNKTSKRIFNYLYYNKQSKLENHYHVDNFINFLHPLDRLNNWNKLYGDKGFYQFQCQLPHENSKEVFKIILAEIDKSRQEPFLPVLKPLGEIESLGILSFAKPGITVSVDFENKGSKTKKLFKKLTEITIDAGGRLYLAKDILMDPISFEKSYSNIEVFKTYRDPAISSSLSRRLMGY